MRRPPSYSDSYLVRTASIQGTLTPILEPLVIPVSYPPELKLNEPYEEKPYEEKSYQEKSYEEKPFEHVCVIFIIKGSLHLFFISMFETIFYFLYVSKSEDQGILNTINTYYNPLVQSCAGWSNMSKGLIGLILKEEFNQTIIDNEGQASALQRANFNTGLLYRSIWYSVACLGICFAMVAIVFLRKINVKWRKLMIEHLAFVFILGLYEYFFYETIIYNYMTISTSELNQHIIDGMYQCISN